MTGANLELRDAKDFRRSSILGGCCGTDHRHVEAIFQACTTC
jgi:methionine synthase I (cobalamin-dependent)